MLAREYFTLTLHYSARSEQKDFVILGFQLWRSLLKNFASNNVRFELVKFGRGLMKSQSYRNMIVTSSFFIENILFHFLPISRGCLPARQCASICSRLFPLVSGTSR